MGVLAIAPVLVEEDVRRIGDETVGQGPPGPPPLWLIILVGLVLVLLIAYVAFPMLFAG